MENFVKISFNRTLSSIAVVASAIIFAIQDVWISTIVRDVDPLIIVFWIFLGVVAIAAALSFAKGESLSIKKAAWPALLWFNVTTAIAWIFTFVALSRISPSVVSAATLSTPPILIMLFLERGRISVSAFFALGLIICGLIIGLFSKNEVVVFDWLGLAYCALASVGVVGNSICMRRLNQLGCKGNGVLALRFTLLLGVIFAYFLMQQISLALPTDLIPSVVVLTLITTYIPLLVLYFAHLHLNIYVINMGLALTPIATILVYAFVFGLGSIDAFQGLSVVLVITGVAYEYWKQ